MSAAEDPDTIQVARSRTSRTTKHSGQQPPSICLSSSSAPQAPAGRQATIMTTQPNAQDSQPCGLDATYDLLGVIKQDPVEGSPGLQSRKRKRLETSSHASSSDVVGHNASKQRRVDRPDEHLSLASAPASDANSVDQIQSLYNCKVDLAKHFVEIATEMDRYISENKSKASRIKQLEESLSQSESKKRTSDLRGESLCIEIGALKEQLATVGEEKAEDCAHSRALENEVSELKVKLQDSETKAASMHDASQALRSQNEGLKSLNTSLTTDLATARDALEAQQKKASHERHQHITILAEMKAFCKSARQQADFLKTQFGTAARWAKYRDALNRQSMHNLHQESSDLLERNASLDSDLSREQDERHAAIARFSEALKWATGGEGTAELRIELQATKQKLAMALEDLEREKCNGAAEVEIFQQENSELCKMLREPQTLGQPTQQQEQRGDVGAPSTTARRDSAVQTDPSWPSKWASKSSASALGSLVSPGYFGSFHDRTASFNSHRDSIASGNQATPPRDPRLQGRPLPK